MRIKGIGLGFIAIAGSVLLASAALAGVPTERLNGVFSMQDKSEGVDNEACVIASFQSFYLLGEVSETTSDGCLVEIFYQTITPNKASASNTKDDGKGKASVAQQSTTELIGSITDVGECSVPNYSGTAFPEKCKASASVNGSEPSDSTDKGKVSVSCELGSDGSELEPSPTTAQVDKFVEAFSDRKDVNVTDSGKLTIKMSAEQGTFCD